jgi:hypothetical protein
MIEIEKIKELLKFIHLNSLQSRLINKKNESSKWNEWLTMPVNGYFDCGEEPIRISEIRSIELMSHIIKEVGARVPPIYLSKKEEIIAFLKGQEIPFEICTDNDAIRIALSKSNR